MIKTPEAMDDDTRKPLKNAIMGRRVYAQIEYSQLLNLVVLDSFKFKNLQYLVSNHSLE